MGDDSFYVIETISSGAEGHPYDEVMSIGVCLVDLDHEDYESVYDAVILREPKYVGKAKLDYAESKGLETAMLYVGVPEGDVVNELRSIVGGHDVTSYDIRQEFAKYLVNDPWDLSYVTTILPSIMTRQPVSLRCKRPEQEPETIVKAYCRILRDDPANVGGKRGALELAQMASELAIDLHRRGRYRSEPKAEYPE